MALLNLETVLVNCISSDALHRKQAEEYLKGLKTTSGILESIIGYCPELCQILTSGNQQARQLAAVNLKNDIENCWQLMQSTVFFISCLGQGLYETNLVEFLG